MAGVKLMNVLVACLPLMLTLGSILQGVEAQWLSGFRGQAISKPDTRDPVELQEQIESLIAEQETLTKGSQAYIAADEAIAMRKRRISSASYLNEGMTVEVYEQLNAMQDELAPLKAKLRETASSVQGDDRSGTAGETDEHRRLAELDAKVKKILAPYSTTRPGRRPTDLEAEQKHGLNKAQQAKARDLRAKIRTTKDKKKVEKYREQLDRIYTHAKRAKSTQTERMAGRMMKKNHTLAKTRHLEMAKLRDDIAMAHERGHVELAEELRATLKAKQAEYREAELTERDEMAERNRAVMNVVNLLDKAHEDGDDDLIQKYRAQLLEFDKQLEGTA